jgi:hypothetical protein
MQQALREIARLLRNLVASAKALVHYTRGLIRRDYKDTDFLPRYQSEVDRRFPMNPTVQFVEGLRDYCLHYRLPPIAATFRITVDDEVPSQRVVLDKAELQRWNGWSPTAKVFIGASPCQIGIKEVCLQYFSDVSSFFHRMRAELLQIHATELRWLKQAMGRYASLEQAMLRRYGLSSASYGVHLHDHT